MSVALGTIPTRLPCAPAQVTNQDGWRSRNVRRRAEDPGALDVEDGVPPPRAAPPLLRRVVLNRSLDLASFPIMGNFSVFALVVP